MATRTQRAKPAVPPSAPLRQLDTFDNPAPERDYVIRFDVPEFTCLCPLTGQPDFAHFQIEIVADRYCVETKSARRHPHVRDGGTPQEGLEACDGGASAGRAPASGMTISAPRRSPQSDRSDIAWEC